MTTLVSNPDVPIARDEHRRVGLFWHGLRAARSKTRERLVVVGNGMVGQRFCERLVERGGSARYSIVVLAEEPLPAYDRIHLTEIWRGRDARELLLRDVDWYRAQGIDLRLGQAVRTLDRDEKTVTTDTGESLPYDRLVLATGSRAVVPSIEVDDPTALLPYRTIQDAERILAAVEDAKTSDRAVAVLGGGLLGLEAARTLQLLGCRVIVLEGSSQLLPRQLDPHAAEELHRVLDAAGIEIRFRARLGRVTGSNGAAVLELGEHDSLEVGAVVLAAGVRARDEIARLAGLRCHPRGGVEIDRFLRTSDPHIFALGECASHAHVPHGLVAPGYAMADLLVEHLVGRRRPRLTPQRAATRLKLDLTEVTVLGNPLEADAGDDWMWQEPGRYRRLVVRKSRVVAAIGIGQWNEAAVLQQWVVEGRKVALEALVRFRESGNLGLETPGAAITAWSDASIVCQCAKVSCGELRQAIRAGHCTPEALSRATSAGRFCGTCTPLLSALSGGPAAGAVERPSRPLRVAALVALGLGLASAALPRLPVPSTIRAEALELAWIEPLYKQLSGFSLVGLVAIGLTLSLRKRWRKVRFGGYARWRAFHAIVGVLSLLVLVAHTGFRLGHNLNFALMCAFLTSALAGAVYGITMSAGRTPASGPLARRLNDGARLVHDYAVWPLALLAGFHVLKVYYF